MKIKKYEYQKVLKEDVEINLPQEEIYLFQYGLRRSYRVTPEWTTWNVENHGKPEEIWRWDILILDGHAGFANPSMELISIQKHEIETLYLLSKGQSYEIVDFIDGGDERNTRTKEQFEKDFRYVLNKLLLKDRYSDEQSLQEDSI